MAVSNGGYLVRWLSTLLLDFFKKGTREMSTEQKVWFWSGLICGWLLGFLACYIFI